MNTIAANIAQIRQRVEAACRRSDRDPNGVRLIAVSKVKPASAVDQAYRAGQQLFGESYVQEFRDKAAAVTEPVTWHFVGGLQSNKIKYLRGQVAMIHSVDRFSLAKEIDRQWQKIEQSADILIQVNVGEESSKSGCSAADLAPLVRRIATLEQVKIRGLMCLPPLFEDPEQVRPYFRKLYDLSRRIAAEQIPGVEMRELSMGMSGDFEAAIEEGATLVRIGTAIFGARPRKD
jgi:pyridoxal phosphate enzyme (YggS family)